MIVLPDILRYDRDLAAHFHNGRALTDDFYSMRFAWLTNGKASSDGLKPHDDLQAVSLASGCPTRSRRRELARSSPANARS